MLSFAQQQQQQQQHHHQHPHASYNFNFEQHLQQQQHPHHAHSQHSQHSGAFFSSSIQAPSFTVSPLPRHHSQEAGWGISSSAATASMFAREAMSAGSYPRHSMPPAMEQELQRRDDAAAAAARARDFEIATAMQQVDEYCRNYIDFLARELRGEAQPPSKSPTTQRPLQAAAASVNSSRGFDGSTVPAAASGFSAMGLSGSSGLAASIAAILASPEFSPAVVPPLLVQPQAPLPSGSFSAHAASHSLAHTHASAANNKKGAKGNNHKKKKNSKKHVVVKLEAPAEAVARPASPDADDGARHMHDGEHESAENAGEGEDEDEGEEHEQEDRSASSSSASDDDDYRPESSDRKKKAKGRAGLGAIFATPLSKSGRPVGRKVKREESGEDSDAGSDSEDGGGRNKRKSNKSHAPVADSIQRKLPLRAVMTLRTFFIGHIDKPFPTDGEKRSLAAQCSLNFKQVSDWFTNTRKRFWRPHRDHLESVGCILVKEPWAVCACKAGGAAGEKAVKGGTKKKAKAKQRGAGDEEDEEMEHEAEEATAAAAPPTHLHSWMQMWN